MCVVDFQRDRALITSAAQLTAVCLQRQNAVAERQMPPRRAVHDVDHPDFIAKRPKVIRNRLPEYAHLPQIQRNAKIFPADAPDHPGDLVCAGQKIGALRREVLENEADALLRGIVRGALQGSCRAVERFVIALIPHTPARIDQH